MKASCIFTFVVLCCLFVLKINAQVNYTENFDAPGMPDGPVASDYWYFTTDINPLQNDWNDIVPGDGYAYLTVDSDLGNDTDYSLPFQMIVFGEVTPNHRMEIRAKNLVIPGLVSFLFTYKETTVFNEIDIELVADDQETLPVDHDILPPNGWTDVRFNSWSNASPTTFMPVTSTNTSIKDADGNNVSHIDNAFHTYAIDWYETRIDFFIDGVLQTSIEQHVATGLGEVFVGFRDVPWAGTLDWTGTQTMVLDYLKIEPLIPLPCTDLSGVFGAGDCASISNVIVPSDIGQNNGSITFNNLATVGHWELYLDGVYVNSDQGNSYTVNNLAPGDYDYIIIGYDANWQNACPVPFYSRVCEVKLPTEVDLKVFLEGSYKGSLGEMSTDLNSLLPLVQPYNQAPYHYSGSEAMSTIIPDMVDWVLVEARQGTPSLSGSKGTFTMERKAGVLLKNGNIVAPTGGAIVFENLNYGEEYYFCIRHRNHLDVFTNNVVVLSASNSYDFTLNVGQAFGNLQQKQTSDGKAAMFAGDFNQDGLIQTTDYDLWIVNPAQLEGYEPVDGNLDGSVQTTDYDVWFDNKAKIGSPEIGY